MLRQLADTVLPIGLAAEQALFPERTIRLQLQWADPSRKQRRSLITNGKTRGGEGLNVSKKHFEHGDGKRFVVRADEKLSAFVELESPICACRKFP